jgi:superfamily II DNA/RNA helicase
VDGVTGQESLPVTVIPDIPSNLIFEPLLTRFTIPRSPVREENIYTSEAIEEVLPYLGSMIKYVDGQYRVTPALSGLVKSYTPVTALVAGFGAGKTTAGRLLALERALVARENDWDWAGALFLVPINPLAHNMYLSTVDLSARYTRGAVTCRFYHSDLDRALREAIRADPPDILFITPDMYYRTLAGQSKKRLLESEPGLLTNWEERLLKPAFLFADEIDNGSGFTASCLTAMLRVVLDINSGNRGQESDPFKLVLASATVPNAELAFRPVFGDDLTVIKAPAVHGEITIHVYDMDPIVERSREKFVKGKIGERPVDEILRWEHYLKLLVHDSRYRKHKTLVYLDDREMIDRLTKRYGESDVIVFYHAGMTKESKQYALEAFNSGEAQVMVATSAVESGLNVDGLLRVVLVGKPCENRKVIQRMARVARKWSTDGTVIVFLDRNDERDSALLVNLERAEQQLVKPKPEPLVINHANRSVIELELLFRSNAGVTGLGTLEQRASKKKVEECIVNLLVDGKINYHGNKLYRTAFTADALYRAEIRRMETSVPVIARNSYGGKRNIGYMNKREANKRGLKGQQLVKEREIWKVVEVTDRCVAVEFVKLEDWTGEGDSYNFVASNVLGRMVTRLEKIKQSDEAPVRLVRVTEVEQVMALRETAMRNGTVKTDTDLVTGLQDTELKDFERARETEGLVIDLSFRDQREAEFFGQVFFHTANRELLADRRDVVIKGILDGNNRNGKDRGNYASIIYDRLAPAGVSEVLFEEAGKLLERTRELVKECARQPFTIEKELGMVVGKLEAVVARGKDIDGGEKEARVREMFRELVRMLAGKKVSRRNGK